MKSFAMLCVLWMAFVGLAPSAYGQPRGVDVEITVLGQTRDVAGSTSDHFLSFSGPVAIPGVGLAPGAYIFRLIAPSVMQVLSENRSTVYGTFFVIPAWRSEATDDYGITFRRIRYNAPARIATLFLPNASRGYELMYPRIEMAFAGN